MNAKLDAVAEATELREQRALVVEELRTLSEQADAERRDLTREERARWNELEPRAQELQAKITRADQRVAELTGSNRRVWEGEPAERPGAMLTQEQRMLDWLQERGLGGYDAEYDPREFDIGRAVYAMLPGDRSSLTDTEERVLSIGTDAQGGYLLPRPSSGTSTGSCSRSEAPSGSLRSTASPWRAARSSLRRRRTRPPEPPGAHRAPKLPHGPLSTC